ncbi:Maf family protein [Halobacillus salinarum]|uniref:dTTP/UTP pyrophosphatase n=1 Tax=Halobacillus salinarum TaxID=2932257 RepID=A0ABY4ERB5_9BACI|nr:Maf family protein [Halobacillus salinarum]UOQ46247.1 Maf family protein [Halobacillus salinarum]
MLTLVLGSSSPRRKELLEMAGYNFTVRSAGIEEKIIGGSPEEVVRRLAEEKSRAISIRNNEVLLTADTVVVHGQRILGKPGDYEEAYNTLEELSGSVHEVLTAVTIRNSEEQSTLAVSTLVKFFSLTESEIQSYLECKEAWDKAGSYGIQGKGGLFVESIEGDYYSVVGLPLSRVVRELRKFGVLL